MSLFSRGKKIYTVHIRPDRAAAYENAEFVREGFNLMAFLFTGFWTLYHRLWWHTLFIFLLNAAIIALGRAHLLSPDGVAVIQIGMQALIGFHANDWLRGRLARRGYIMADVTASDSLLGAEQRYFERHLSAASS